MNKQIILLSLSLVSFTLSIVSCNAQTTKLSEKAMFKDTVFVSDPANPDNMMQKAVEKEGYVCMLGKYKNHDKVSITDLKAGIMLSPVAKNVKINSFNIGIYQGGNNYATYSESNKLNDEQANLLAKLKTGDKFAIMNIDATLNDKNVEGSRMELIVK